MPIFRLVVSPDLSGKIRTIEFEAEHAAAAFAFVERQNDFVRAEIWQDDKLLCKVEATPETGKIWTVNPASGLDHPGNKKG